MRLLRTTLLILAVMVITSCAHSIRISPDMNAIRGEVSNKSDITVGYYITEMQLATEITSSGGGGDEVTYFPYKDTEVALRSILSEKFSRVYSLKSQSSDALMAEKDIRFVFTPDIKTESSSDSIFTWPPTNFSIELNCKAYSPQGEMVWSKTVTGEGAAEFSDFGSNPGMAAQRASEQAFGRMRDEIHSADVFK